MMNRLRQYIYGILLVLAATACQQESLTPEATGEGTLVVENLRRQVEKTDALTTKAVDSDLIVDIYAGESVGEGKLLHHYEAGATISSLTLAAGSYTLHTYNAALNEEATGNGLPIFEKTHAFQIKSGAINRIDLIVPMINVGVRLGQHLPEAFTNYQLALTQGSRQATLTAGQTAYFAAGKAISYTLTGKNADQEPFSLTESIDAPAQGVIYELQVQLPTNSVSWIMN